MEPQGDVRGVEAVPQLDSAIEQVVKGMRSECKALHHPTFGPLFLQKGCDAGLGQPVDFLKAATLACPSCNG